MSQLPATWDRDLGSVINGQGIMRSDIVCEVGEMPADEVIMTCVAMGCSDAKFAANAVRSDREHNDEFVPRVGFAEQDEDEENILWPEFFGAVSRAASCNLGGAGGTIWGMRGLLLARGN